MSKPTALKKILAVMCDGEARTVSRLYFLTGVNPSTIRRMIPTGDLVKVGEEHPTPPARRGQTIVKIALRHAA